MCYLPFYNYTNQVAPARAPVRPGTCGRCDALGSASHVEELEVALWQRSAVGPDKPNVVQQGDAVVEPVKLVP